MQYRSSKQATAAASAKITNCFRQPKPVPAFAENVMTRSCLFLTGLCACLGCVCAHEVGSGRCAYRSVRACDPALLMQKAESPDQSRGPGTLQNERTVGRR